MKVKGWHRGEHCDVAISDNELEILENYEAEEERGILHSALWHQRMRQLEVLRERKEREEAE